MPAPSAIEVSRTIEFNKAVGFQLNETPGKLRALCGSTGNHKGKKAQIEDRFDDLYGAEITSRNGDTNNTDASLERRFINKPRRFSIAPLLDPDDDMSTEIDLHAPIATQAARAIRRGQDDYVMDGFYGTAYTGENGDTAVAFKAANIIASDYSTTGTDTGITLNKLMAVLELFRTNLVDLEAETPVGVLTAKQMTDLLKIAQVQSRDFNPLAMQQTLQSGKVAHFMGIDFVLAEIGNAKAYPKTSVSSLASAGIRRVPFFVRSGLHFGVWNDFTGKISQRDDKNMSWQVWGETCATGTRLNEDKCIQLLCKEG